MTAAAFFVVICLAAISSGSVQNLKEVEKKCVEESKIPKELLNEVTKGVLQENVQEKMFLLCYNRTIDGMKNGKIDEKAINKVVDTFPEDRSKGFTSVRRRQVVNNCVNETQKYGNELDNSFNFAKCYYKYLKSDSQYVFPNSVSKC